MLVPLDNGKKITQVRRVSSNLLQRAHLPRTLPLDCRPFFSSATMVRMSSLPSEERIYHFFLRSTNSFRWGNYHPNKSTVRRKETWCH